MQVLVPWFEVLVLVFLVQLHVMGKNNGFNYWLFLLIYQGDDSRVRCWGIPLAVMDNLEIKEVQIILCRNKEVTRAKNIALMPTS